MFLLSACLDVKDYLPPFIQVFPLFLSKFQFLVIFKIDGYKVTGTINNFQKIK